MNSILNKKGSFRGMGIFIGLIAASVFIILMYLGTMIPRGPTSAAVWGVILFIYGYFLFGKVILKGEDTKIALWASLILAILVAVQEMIPESMLQGVQNYLGNPRTAIILLYVLITIIVLVWKGLKPITSSDATQKTYEKFFGSPARELIKKGGDVSFSEKTKKDLEKALEKNVEGFERQIEIFRDLGKAPQMWYGSSSGPAAAPHFGSPAGPGIAAGGAGAAGIPGNIFLNWYNQAQATHRGNIFREGIIAPAYKPIQFIQGLKEKTESCLNDATRKRTIHELRKDYEQVDTVLRNAYDSLKTMRDAADTRLQENIDNSTDDDIKNKWRTLKEGIYGTYNNLMEHIANYTGDVCPNDLETRGLGLSLGDAIKKVVWSACAIEAEEKSGNKLKEVIAKLSFRGQSYSGLGANHKRYVDDVTPA